MIRDSNTKITLISQSRKTIRLTRTKDGFRPRRIILINFKTWINNRIEVIERRKIKEENFQKNQEKAKITN